MEYRQALSYLNEVEQENLKLTITNIQRIVRSLPFDYRKLKFIQIAGTNGKGSTAYFLSSIMQRAGYKVGLFTSPHLADVRERIMVNRRWISKKDFALGLNRVRKISENLVNKGKITNIPTFFEYIFLISLYHFYLQKVDFAVMEVGLGGRLDATTTLKPLLAVITNISKDHTEILGTHLKEIAVEKAGIIKNATPLVCGCRSQSAPARVIARIAKEKKVPLHWVLNGKNKLHSENVQDGYRCCYRTDSGIYDFTVALKGLHQTVNAATAVQAVRVLNSLGWTFPTASIPEGIRDCFIPARIEMISQIPPIVLDGGHNVEGIRVLTDFLSEKRISHATLVFGVLRDKDFRGMIALLKPFVSHVILTEPFSHRALPAERLVRFFSEKIITIEKDFYKALHVAKKRKRTIIITGSLYLAGSMRHAILGGQERGHQKIQGS